MLGAWSSAMNDRAAIARTSLTSIHPGERAAVKRNRRKREAGTITRATHANLSAPRPSRPD
jgi:hypothetical protein